MRPARGGLLSLIQLRCYYVAPPPGCRGGRRRRGRRLSVGPSCITNNYKQQIVAPRFTRRPRLTRLRGVCPRQAAGASHASDERDGVPDAFIAFIAAEDPRLRSLVAAPAACREPHPISVAMRRRRRRW